MHHSLLLQVWWLSKELFLFISCINLHFLLLSSITAPFNNMRTLKFKAQLTNAFFSLSSIKCSAAPSSFRLCCLNCAQRFDLITAHSAVVRSWEEPPNDWLTVAKVVISISLIYSVLKGGCCAILPVLLIRAITCDTYSWVCLMAPWCNRWTCIHVYTFSWYNSPRKGNKFVMSVKIKVADDSKLNDADVAH